MSPAILVSERHLTASAEMESLPQSSSYSENGHSLEINDSSKIMAPTIEPDISSTMVDNTVPNRSTPSLVSSAVAHAVSKGCLTAAVCITEAQKRASDLFASTFTTAAGFLARPLVTAIASGRRSPLDITSLIEGGVPEIVILGRLYRVDRAEEKDEFLEDYYSRVIFTYRRNFSPIDVYTQNNDDIQSQPIEAPVPTEQMENLGETLNSGSATECPPSSVPFFQRVISRNTAGQITSDAGWGCMIRATQMAIAQSLLTLRLGRDWRRRRRRRRRVAKSETPRLGDRTMDDESPSPYQFESSHIFTSLISLFADQPNHPLSIHSFARLGSLNLGIPVGQWLGPTSCAQAATALMTSPRNSLHFPDIVPLIFPDGLLVHSSVHNIFQTSEKAALVILCMRLGTDRFNVERYRTPLAQCFRLPQFQGLAGGGSLTSAYFFFGICARGLLYLDPHIAIQPAFSPELLLTHSKSLHSTPSDVPSYAPTAEMNSSPDPYDDEYDSLIIPYYELQFFLTVQEDAGPSVLPWNSINPSMALYFLCRTPDEYSSLVDGLKNAASNVSELFEMRESPLDLSRAAGMQLNEFNLEDDEFNSD